MSKWPIVRLGEVLRRSDETVTLKPDEAYSEITIRLWGKGVCLRRTATGAEMAALSRRVVRTGQLVLSRIDARNGAIGIVPAELDGAVVSNDFPSFAPDRDRVLPAYMGWLVRSDWLVDQCRSVSEGTTNRVRLNEVRFLALRVPLPPLSEQRRIVAWLDAIEGRVGEVERLRAEVGEGAWQAVLRRCTVLAATAPRARMADVAPLVRRAVTVSPEGEYDELGIRSFGKGTFHKPPVQGAALGTKRVFWVEPDDLVFNIVFAWEGAVAIAQPNDAGRVGSHRFLTCVPRPGVVTAEYLWAYFMTDEGIAQLGAASPGGAGRNRTLGLEALARIWVPVPAHSEQVAFANLIALAADCDKQRLMSQRGGTTLSACTAGYLRPRAESKQHADGRPTGRGRP